MRGFNAQRPQTAAPQESMGGEKSAALPPPTTTVMGAPANNARTEMLNFHPAAQSNEMHFMDDDEDLRQQIEEMGGGPRKEPLDPET